MEPTTNTRHPYFSLKTSFIGATPFCIEVPPLPPAPKFLPFRVPRETFARYRPTSFEVPTSSLLSDNNEGIHVDLIGIDVFTDSRETADVSADGKSTSNQQLLDWRDAQLLVGIVPNVEHLVMRSPSSKTSSKVPARQAVDGKASHLPQPPMPSDTTRHVVSRIEKSFHVPTAIKHPTKPHLKPVKILPIYPDTGLWTNNYKQVAIEDAEQRIIESTQLLNDGTSSDGNCPPYVLQYIEASKTLKRFGLYEGAPSGSGSRRSRNDAEPTGGDTEGKIPTRLYNHIRDYIVETRAFNKHRVVSDIVYLMSIPSSPNTSDANSNQTYHTSTNQDEATSSSTSLTGDGQHQAPSVSITSKAVHQAATRKGVSSHGHGGGDISRSSTVGVVDSTLGGCVDGSTTKIWLKPFSSDNGPKLIFEKARAKLGCDSARHKNALILSLRERTKGEEENLKKDLAMFDDTAAIFASSDDVDSGSSRTAEESASSSSHSSSRSTRSRSAKSTNKEEQRLAGARSGNKSNTSSSSKDAQISKLKAHSTRGRLTRPTTTTSPNSSDTRKRHQNNSGELSSTTTNAGHRRTSTADDVTAPDRRGRRGDTSVRLSGGVESSIVSPTDSASDAAAGGSSGSSSRSSSGASSSSGSSSSSSSGNEEKGSRSASASGSVSSKSSTSPSRRRVGPNRLVSSSHSESVDSSRRRTVPSKKRLNSQNGNARNRDK